MNGAGVSLLKGIPGNWARADMGQVLDAVAARSPSKPALICRGHETSYEELAVRSRRLAGGLAAAGMHAGESAVLLMDNSPEWVATFFALARLGCATVAVNPRFVPREIAYILKQSGSSMLIATRAFGRTTLVDLLHEIAPDVRTDGRHITTARFPELRTLVAMGKGPTVDGALDYAAIEAGPELIGDLDRSSDVGIVQYTSGTTGFPKGVMLRQSQVLRNAVCVGRRLGARPSDRFYSPMPFFHVGGSVLSILLTVANGATLIFHPTFDPEEMLRTIDAQRCTLTAGVETMFLRLMRLPEFESFEGRSLRAGWGAAYPAVFDHLSGFVSIYGMSEASPNAAMAYWDEPLKYRRDACGWVQEGIELGISDRDSQTNEWLPIGEHGEIRVRGWSVMAGYLNDPEVTAQTITPDGWLRTGDIGWIDDEGAVHFVGRAKETIRVGGELVSAREVEAVYADHPNVRAACVLPLADPKYLEVPVLFVEIKDAPALEAELIDYGRRHLAYYKVPRRVIFVRDWPVTESGKIQKFKLLERLAREAPA